MATVIRGRNMDGIQHEALRKKLDAIVYEAHDELSDAWYNHWKQGESFDWMGVDATKFNDPKKVFDTLHGLISHLYSIIFHEVAQLDPDGPDPLEYNVEEVDADGNVAVWKDDFARQWIGAHLTRRQIQWLKNNLRPRVVNWVKNNLGHDIEARTE